MRPTARPRSRQNRRPAPASPEAPAQRSAKRIATHTSTCGCRLPLCGGQWRSVDLTAGHPHHPVRRRMLAPRLGLGGSMGVSYMARASPHLRDALGGGSQYRGRRQAAEHCSAPAGAYIPRSVKE